jgi:hypothetical protein
MACIYLWIGLVYARAGTCMGWRDGGIIIILGIVAALCVVEGGSHEA